MKITVGTTQRGDVTIFPVFQQSSIESFPYDVREHTKQSGAVTWFFGKNNESHTLIVGLGDKSEFCLDTLRKTAGVAGRALEKEKFTTVSADLTEIEQQLKETFYMTDLVTAWVEGWLLGTYKFDKYKAEKKPHTVTKMSIHVRDDADAIDEAIQYGVIRAEGTCLARDLCNEPPNKLRPLTFADTIVQHFAGEKNVEVTVYEGEALERQQFSGLIAVGKGSEHPPAFIEVRYCTDETLPLIALVGKGMTFDTGGISLKRGRNISDMRMDMGGAAAVIGALHILVKHQVNANVVVYVPTAENIPSSRSLLPGEIIQYPNHISVQVGNTDAEGRLILADALIRAKRQGAKTVIDIATLTGACAQALGPEMAGIWGDNPLVDALKQLGEQNGDYVWPMPLQTSYAQYLKSDYADVMNISNVSFGGAITAALFLHKFVDSSMEWAHIDMAGPMERSKTDGYYVKGASGFGARLLADVVISKSYNY